MNSRSSLILLLAGMLGCMSGGSDNVTPVNNPPTIDLLFTKIGVVRGVPVDIGVAVDDLDGDPLKLTWEISRGSLTPQNSENTVMRWATPVTLGTDTLTVRVSDGKSTKSVTSYIKIGYAAPGQIALSLYEKAKSPYIVSPSPTDPTVTVDLGTTTTIEAGAELLIDVPGTVIKVAGATLISNGTSAEPAVIRPNDQSFRCNSDQRGWWNGIVGLTDVSRVDGYIELHHTEIRYGQYAVELRDHAKAVLDQCMIRCSGETGVLIGGSGSLTLLDTEVSNGKADGVAIKAFASTPDSVIVRGCDITFNGNSGIRMDINDTARAVPIDVEYNRIEFNTGRGITLASAVFPRIHFNQISGNGVSSGVVNIYLDDGYPKGVTVPQLDAGCNYWGAAIGDSLTIHRTIRDARDSNAVHTHVIVSPWLNASPLTTTPSCTPGTP